MESIWATIHMHSMWLDWLDSLNSFFFLLWTNWEKCKNRYCTLLDAWESADRGISSAFKSAQVPGNRCSCTLANLLLFRKKYRENETKKSSIFHEIWHTYRLSVTNVPVNFLHRLSADSNRSGSSFRNFSSRTTFSISFDRIFRNAFCSDGNLIFSSATVLLFQWRE